VKGFVHVEAGRLVDGGGNPLVLRGVGLGNWLLPEGYMWRFESTGPQSPRQIEALIEDLVGPKLAAEFWTRFRTTFITEDDIARIRAEGMNHVRLPINSRVVMDDDGALIESGLLVIDRLIQWCRNHELWVVLDLHGAPGGQTGTNIDDSAHGTPELFTDDRSRARTVRLWRALAERYREEPAVAAYDLLNEPLPNQYQDLYAGRLRELYMELTAAIREVDPNHMITYEGTHWATNWSIFTEVWDPNSLLQFHKYWTAPDRPSIRQYMDVGRSLGLPIYMGEGGENYLDWLQTAFQLFDDCGISWNFWTWKKIDTLTSPCSVVPPPGWRDITDYAAARSAKPSPDQAWQTLGEVLEAMHLSRCTYRAEVIAALFRRAPVKIPASGFGFEGAGRSYYTTSASPLAGFRSDDKVTIRDARGNGSELDWNHAAGPGRSAEQELLVSLGSGDWVAYEVEVTEPAPLAFLIMSNDGRPTVELSVDEVPIQVEGAVAGQVRGTTSGPLAAGRHIVRLTARRDDTLIGSIQVTPVGREAE
jgi:aryl-phospho-beta-D-glucosidase BglC (GH1 family)